MNEHLPVRCGFVSILRFSPRSWQHTSLPRGKGNGELLFHGIARETKGDHTKYATHVHLPLEWQWNSKRKKGAGNDMILFSMTLWTSQQMSVFDGEKIYENCKKFLLLILRHPYFRTCFHTYFHTCFLSSMQNIIIHQFQSNSSVALHAE